MSWMSRQSLLWRSETEPYVQMPVQTSELRELIGLKWNLRPEDERMSSEELGRRIDHCLVETTSIKLHYLTAETLKVEEFKSNMLRIKHLMTEDGALMDFAETLKRREQPLLLASEVYIELVCRRVLSDRRWPPSREWGRRFAQVMLDEINDDNKWEFDWDRGTAIAFLRYYWAGCLDPVKRKNIIQESARTPYVWDALLRICEDFPKTGETPPDDLLEWSFKASHGHLMRPSEGPPIPNRPRVFGYMLRDNEIRHTVDLLRQVGMPKTDAYKAVGKSLNLSHRTIGRIYGKPYSTIVDLREHMRMRLDSILPSPRVT